MIYDLRGDTTNPIADSQEVKDKHTDIVWECKWIERPNDKNEIIDAYKKVLDGDIDKFIFDNLNFWNFFNCWFF